MLHYWRIAGLYLRLGVLTDLEYRVNFFVQIFQSLLSLILSLGGLAVIFENTDNLNGWKPPELLSVVGVFFLIGGLIKLVVQPSLTRFMEAVREGTLDFTLLKPINAQFVVSAWQVQIWEGTDVLIGLVVLAVALTQLQVQAGWLQVVQFGAALLAGGLIVYSFWLMLATLTFWFINLDNSVIIFESLYEAGRWPVSIYPGWLRFSLTFLVPVAFAVTVPAEVLTARLAGESLVAVGALAGVLLVVSHAFWRYGIRHYTGASA